MYEHLPDTGLSVNMSDNCVQYNLARSRYRKNNLLHSLLESSKLSYLIYAFFNASSILQSILLPFS